MTLLEAAKAMAESYTDHVDRCRLCTVNWQNLKAAIAAQRAEAQSPKLTTEQIAAWAERHDIQGNPQELRAIIEDARTIHLDGPETP